VALRSAGDYVIQLSDISLHLSEASETSDIAEMCPKIVKKKAQRYGQVILADVKRSNGRSTMGASQWKGCMREEKSHALGKKIQRENPQRALGGTEKSLGTLQLMVWSVRRARKN
jgi:hypothetical protein